MVRKAAIIGAGGIGGGWAARFLLNGWSVSVFDPDPEAPRKLADLLAAARASLPALCDLPMPPEGCLTFADSIAEAVRDAEYVQESVPDQLDLKQRVIAEIQHVAPDVPVGSSSSGFKPSELQQGAPNPATILVAQAVPPVYLLPLVEVVPSPACDVALIAAVMEILRGLGMFPVHLRTEPAVRITDRLLLALWREASGLVTDGVATAAEIEDAVQMGFGLALGQMGLFHTIRLAGHAVATGLVTPPAGSEPQSPRNKPANDAARACTDTRQAIRDRNLVGALRGLKDRDWGAGKVLLDHDARRRALLPPPGTDAAAPMVTAHMQVLPGWIDYNGHMTESRYLFACSETTDGFLRLIGAGVDYVAGGFSYYSAETHILHRAESKPGDRLTGSVQVLDADAKRLHLFVRIERAGQTVATLEQMLLHVDMAAGRACPASDDVMTRLMPIAAAHKALPVPESVGRHVGKRKGG